MWALHIYIYILMTRQTVLHLTGNTKKTPFLNVSLLFCKVFLLLSPLQFSPKVYSPQYKIYKVSLSMS